MTILQFEIDYDKGEQALEFLHGTHGDILTTETVMNHGTGEKILRILVGVHD